MHGHGLRLLAEQEHVDEWADVTPGAIYGAIKRLATGGLIETIRVEKDGNYPERQVYGITAAGLKSLKAIRVSALETIVHRPDPFDLAMARLGEENLDDLNGLLETRLAELRGRVEAEQLRARRIGHYRTITEKAIARHDLHRLQAEISWHEELLGQLPEIVADEQSRKRFSK